MSFESDDTGAEADSKAFATAMKELFGLIDENIFELVFPMNMHADLYWSGTIPDWIQNLKDSCIGRNLLLLHFAGHGTLNSLGELELQGNHSQLSFTASGGIGSRSSQNITATFTQRLIYEMRSMTYDEGKPIVTFPEILKRMQNRKQDPSKSPPVYRMLFGEVPILLPVKSLDRPPPVSTFGPSDPLALET
ncbi:hypothetical protein TWF225_009582 [Orbilia oligospora]|nr:hypothetical protein TWF225_009582 [Orbilia oligospora]KAF3249831.1 hypothetical protein TWF217_008738 [Orbilia oligospora]KAF3259356.1 hypothetical protein TWF128_004422 [Orbilia oligospora]